MMYSLAPAIVALIMATAVTVSSLFAPTSSPIDNNIVRKLTTTSDSECESTVKYSYTSDDASSPSTTIAYKGTPWIQLDLTSTELKPNAKLIITGSSASQELDASGLASSNGYSAVFDGDSVVVELVAPSANNMFRSRRGTNGKSRVVVSALNVGVCSKGPPVAESICGLYDDRVQSFDPRVGRIRGCSAFLISENEFIMAGELIFAKE